MKLGERIRTARLEAGLSQRALCGDRITRNMLSQIENGTAHPSMATLSFLAAGLGKPMSFFLEEDAVSSPNLAVIRRLRESRARGALDEALETLKDYRAGDEIFDPEFYLLESGLCYRAAERAAMDGKIPYAEALLTRSLLAGEKTPYPTEKIPALTLETWLKREEPEVFSQRMDTLSKALAEGQGERVALLFARKALNQGNYAAIRPILEQVSGMPLEKVLLLGESCLAEKAYAQAAEAFLQAESLLQAQGGDTAMVYAKLETCFRELEDYKMAYFYAAKQKP